MKGNILSRSVRCVWEDEIGDKNFLEMERCDEKTKATHYR